MNDGEVKIQDDTILDVVDILSQAPWDNKREWEFVDLCPYSNDVLYTYSIMMYMRLYIYVLGCIHRLYSCTIFMLHIYILGYILVYYVYGKGSPCDMMYM
jgi:hypothetical protein